MTTSEGFEALRDLISRVSFFRISSNFSKRIFSIRRVKNILQENLAKKA